MDQKTNFFEPFLKGSLDGPTNAPPQGPQQALTQPSPAPLPPSLSFRSIFISDVHLGSREAKTAFLQSFLDATQSEHLYLVGDLIDGWRMAKKRGFWDDSHTTLVETAFEKASAGTKVTYIPGNHDEFMRRYVGHRFGGIELRRDALHEAADGRVYLVLHGDEFDGICKKARWKTFLGDKAYVLTMRLNDGLYWLQQRLGLPYWSLAGYLKSRLRGAAAFIEAYEREVAQEAELRGVDGVICGHIHHARMGQMGGIAYMNDGDWVESCTALVEDHEGEFSLLRWVDGAPVWLDGKRTKEVA